MRSQSYIQTLSDSRRRYIDLAMRQNGFNRPLSQPELGQFFTIKKQLELWELFRADTQLDTGVPVGLLDALDRLMYTMWVHVPRMCDCCGQYLATDRIICLECKPDISPFDSIDLCGNKVCMGSKVTRDDLKHPHLPSHRTFKARKFLMLRDLGRAWRRAEDAVRPGDKAITVALAEHHSEKLTAEEDIHSLQPSPTAKEFPPPVARETPTPASSARQPMTPTKPSETDYESFPPTVQGPELSTDNAQGLGSSSTDVDLQYVAMDRSLAGALEPTVIEIGYQADFEPQGETDFSPTESRIALNRSSRASRCGSSDILNMSRLCYYCRGKLGSPCWYCIDCTGISGLVIIFISSY